MKSVNDDQMEGWHGWDDYAPFYDWENTQTLGRRDVQFWVNLAIRFKGPVLELGCGTGRLSLPVAKRVERFIGIDRSASMLARLSKKFRRAGLSHRAEFVRGDIRMLPFKSISHFKLVMAPYGMLQSLLYDTDLSDTLSSVSEVVPSGGMFGIDLVPDLPRWQEYNKRVSLRGRNRRGNQITLIETVRQDHERQLTIFDQEFVERRGRQRETHRFSLAFRTLSVREISHYLENAGFVVDAVLGDYRGRTWSPEADVWIILARRR